MDHPGPLTLARMPVGQEGMITGIAGEWEFTHRLESLGIRPGQQVRKVSALFLGGPVTIQVEGRTQVALGRGLAHQVFVELEG